MFILLWGFVYVMRIGSNCGRFYFIFRFFVLVNKLVFRDFWLLEVNMVVVLWLGCFEFFEVVMYIFSIKKIFFVFNWKDR